MVEEGSCTFAGTLVIWGCLSWHCKPKSCFEVSLVGHPNSIGTVTDSLADIILLSVVFFSWLLCLEVIKKHGSWDTSIALTFYAVACQTENESL